jgi:hypothetical protein
MIQFSLAISRRSLPMLQPSLPDFCRVDHSRSRGGKSLAAHPESVPFVAVRVSRPRSPLGVRHRPPEWRCCTSAPSRTARRSEIAERSRGRRAPARRTARGLPPGTLAAWLILVAGSRNCFHLLLLSPGIPLAHGARNTQLRTTCELREAFHSRALLEPVWS